MANEHRFKDIGVGVKHGQLAISVKFPTLIDKKLREIPEKSKVIRQWVIKGMLAEGLITEDEYQVAIGSETLTSKKES